MLIVLASVIVLEQWLDATASQLLVNTPSYLAHQLSYIFVYFHVFLACWGINTSDRILALQIDPNLFKSSFLVFLSLPKLVLCFEQLYINS
jgi:hypothetical protein